MTPPVPWWVRGSLERLLPQEERAAILAELTELHAAWTARHGLREADRRYRRELRRWPPRLLFARLVSARVTGPVVPAGLPGDLVHAARSLVRSPGLTAAIVLTVGVGIGGCTAVFAVVDTLFLRPLPYPDADRLVWVYTDAPPYRFNFSVVDFEALRAQQGSFESLAAVQYSTRTWVTAEGATRQSLVEATPGFFELFGRRPTAGRLPRPNEGAPDAPATVLVTAGFAGRALGATRADASDVIGRSLDLDGVPHEVIGVLPSGPDPVTRSADVFPTLRLQPPARKGPFFLRVYGRLRPDVDASVASAELAAINERLFPFWADSYQDRNTSWAMVPVREVASGNTAGLLRVLMGAVLMLLLIATANAANLLLTRVTARRGEMIVRAALGASRFRLGMHLLVESALLAAGGVAVGLLAARGAIALLPVVAWSYLPRLGEVGFSGPVLAFALALAAGSGLLLGLVPALAGQPREGGLATQRPGSRLVAGGGPQRLLVAAQLAAVVPLLTGVLLLVSSFARLRAVDPGFEPEGLLTMRASLSPATYPDGDARAQLWDQALERIEAIPGVVAAAVSSERPPDDVGDINNFALEDRPVPAGESEPTAPWIRAEPAYFEVMGIPLLEGRGFLPSDLDDEAPRVLLVDEAWARRYYPGESALGRRMIAGGDVEGPRFTVVGVVGEVPYLGLGRDTGGAIYDPGARFFANPWLMVRVAGDPASVTPRVREALRSLDTSVPLTEVATGPELLDGTLAGPRHLTALLTGFSTVALLLAVIGLYGVTAHSVQKRRGDIAVRLALGGSPRAVLGLVLREGMGVAATGMAFGVVASLSLTGLLSGLLYGVAPRDPVTLLGTAALLLAVSAVACLIPGRRAVRVDPAAALRDE